MGKYKYRTDEIILLKKLANDMKLEGAEILDKYALSELQNIANGIGSESMPGWTRDVVSELYPTLEPVALIHDVEWSGETKTKEHFKETNKRFKKNGYKAAVYCRYWFDPRRYLVMYNAKRFATICQLLGWKAYVSGKKEDYDADTADINYEKIN